MLRQEIGINEQSFYEGCSIVYDLVARGIRYMTTNTETNTEEIIKESIEQQMKKLQARLKEQPEAFVIKQEQVDYTAMVQKDNHQTTAAIVACASSACDTSLTSFSLFTKKDRQKFATAQTALAEHIEQLAVATSTLQSDLVEKINIGSNQNTPQKLKN